MLTKCFDHKPILVARKHGNDEEGRLRNKLFRYEVSSDTDEDCGRKIERLWTLSINHNSSQKEVKCLLRKCGMGLKKWITTKKMDKGALIKMKIEKLKVSKIRTLLSMRK